MQHITKLDTLWKFSLKKSLQERTKFSRTRTKLGTELDEI
jgi:hypothetical protein